MKDCYSFDLYQAGLDPSYEEHYQAYRRIFDRWAWIACWTIAMSGPVSSSKMPT